MQQFSKFTPKIETNPTASQKAQGWVTFKQIFSVGSVNYSCQMHHLIWKKKNAEKG